MRGSAVTQKEIHVGIVGADIKASWAKVSHILAINALPGLKLAVVATRNEQSAREAAAAFGADRWFSDPFVMIRDDRIDVITVAVKVPAHREPILAALNAGKAIYCEAPLVTFGAEAILAGPERPPTDRPTCRGADRARTRRHRRLQPGAVPPRWRCSSESGSSGSDRRN
jgi:hypothetical protein